LNPGRPDNRVVAQIFFSPYPVYLPQPRGFRRPVGVGLYSHTLSLDSLQN